jgi:hypothetical protein
MEDDSEFIPLKQLIDRDVKNISEEQIVYQIQSEKDCIIAQIVPVGKYNKIPIKSILEVPLDKYKCQLMSFLITIEEIEKEEHLRLIGFLIYFDDRIVASLDLVFKPKNKLMRSDVIVNEKKDIKNIDGTYEIIFITGSEKKIQVMITLDRYPGREESVYLLVELLYSIDF